MISQGLSLIVYNVFKVILSKGAEMNEHILNSLRMLFALKYQQRITFMKYNRIFVDTNIFIYAIMIRKFFGVKMIVINTNERMRQNGSKKDINFL